MSREEFEVTPDQVLDELLDCALVVPIPTGSGDLIRSRMAETVRLLARLRQLFPQHKDGNWVDSSTLVSDFRLLVRRREFPRRDLSPDDAISDLEGEHLLSEEGMAAVRALLEARGPDFRLSRFQIDSTKRILEGVKSGRGGGTIIGAGTGSGKTLAFYLPALSVVAQSLGGKGATRIVALYPRNELLRDQLSQALRETRTLAESADLPRAIRVGRSTGGRRTTASP